MKVRVEPLRDIIGAAFPDLWSPVEAVLSTVLAMVPDDVMNPPTCILTGPASSGKTTVLDFLSEIKGISYRSDRFTPRALVSHAANVRRKDLDEIDLLPRIQHRALVTPELAPMFRGKEEVLTETFAVLTAVLDGHGYIGDSGTQGRRGYVGDYLFAWLGATTPLPTYVWRVMAQLGSRLSFYAMPDGDLTDAELDDALAGEPYRRRVEACRNAVGVFLPERFREYGGVRGVRWDRTGDSPVIRDRLKALARLVAKLRGIVSVWKDRDGEDLAYTPPNVEAPYRALACLYNLARGRALLYGRTRLGPEDLNLVTHVALSSAPHERAKLLRALVEQGGSLTTAGAADALHATAPTARKAMKALAVLGIAEPAGEGDHADGATLTLGARWRGALGLDLDPTHTGADRFQPPKGREAEVESEKALCMSEGEVDPWPTR